MPRAIRKMPKSEFRRRYMADMVGELKAGGLSGKEARLAASAVMAWLQERMLRGMDVDFGFMKLKLTRQRPRTYRYNVAKDERDRVPVYQGETFKWVAKVHRSWVDRNSPKWG